MRMAQLYYVVRKLRTWVDQAVVPPERSQDLPLYQLVVMRDILETPNSTVQEISRRLNLAQSMVSKVVAQAKENDLIITTVDACDRRKVRIAPSQRLMEFIGSRLDVSVEDALEPLWGHLSQEEKDCILRAFKLLHQLFKAQELDSQ